MKKLLTLIMVAVLSLGAVFGLTACNNGELDYTGAIDQDTAFMEVKAGTSDIAVMDNIMAGFYVSKPENQDLMLLTSEEFTFDGEYYSIGFRKGGNTASYVNYALYKAQESGKLLEIATTYGVAEAITTIPQTEKPEAPADGSDFKYILDKGEMILGYTIFEPIAYLENDELVGFDIDLAKEVCAILSAEYGTTINLKNVKINWDTKEDELNNKNIDCIWNGFTYTEARAENISFTEMYMVNRQIMVIRKADQNKYTSYASMKNAKFTAEKESAGETTIKEIIVGKVFGK